jgi:hypothetical protein
MILSYPGRRNAKSRHVNLHLYSEEAAAIYDLIFNEAPLRGVALKTGLSYQGVYIRSLAYVKSWVASGALKMDNAYVNDLQTYGHDETNKEGEQNETI